MSEGKDFCKNCANCEPAICRSCVTVVLAGGEEKKPSLYCPMDGALTQQARANDVRSLIIDYIMDGFPIPVSDVLRYNSCFTERDKH